MSTQLEHQPTASKSSNASKVQDGKKAPKIQYAEEPPNVLDGENALAVYPTTSTSTAYKVHVL